MTKQALFPLSILLVFLLHCITTLGQPAAAPVQPANAPVQPANAPVQPATPPVVQPAKAPAPVQSAKVPPTKKVPTEAGDAGEFPLTVTTAGNQVNISSVLVNTTLGGTVYSDNQLDIYQVDQVLLPLDIFNPKPKHNAPASAPTLSKPKSLDNGAGADADADTPSVAAKVDESGALSLKRHRNGILMSIGAALVAFIVTKGL
ncbi:uncharacterized protein LOC112031094 [Quercus suber]|uniref:uncharacterized protein LOC112031094 n=1 Tax=Quercus suber TaxID=58331 RepID=UPI0032DECDB6